MIAKLLNLVGVGSPNVDLVLSKTNFHPGDTVTGAFHFRGGISTQTVKRLECDLMKKEPGENPVWIQAVTTILMARTMESGTREEYPFSFEIPDNIDCSNPALTYELKTRLVFTNDKKTSDTDMIHIIPRHE
ncbi:sporulation protein [Halobacillus sp. ACCC02827]|uniref:sporulation protein n=1 Tax=Bacillaceae TaxID=186817 RepID=UPI0002A4DCCD|nr:MULTISPECIES: sporulation protein [Bacillaceae]ELK44680.1 putative sporulation control protein [Halobacillus sp. BAB-2008]QHT46984.1 sporulation protein [Bacillus sp. SB49]WJE14210.1 sporulation protein [Halobacillus sp. ACCC02827]